MATSMPAYACSGESAGEVLYHFIEVCRNIRHTHRELKTKHLGSADPIVNVLRRANFCNQK